MQCDRFLKCNSVKGGVQPPIYVRPQIRFTDTGGKIDVTVGIKPVLASAKSLPEGVILAINH